MTSPIMTTLQKAWTTQACEAEVRTTVNAATTWTLDGVDDEHDAGFIEYRKAFGFQPFDFKNQDASMRRTQIVWDAVDRTQNIKSPNRKERGFIHSPNEVAAYYEVAAGFHNKMLEGNIIQLGIYRGGSACAIALGMKDAKLDTPMVCVDIFKHAKPHETTDDVMLGQKHLIEELEFSSCIVSVWHEAAAFFSNFWDYPIRFALVDTSHSVEQTTKEINVIAPHMISGGWLAFHDYKPRFGVPRAIHDWLGGVNRQPYNLRFIHGSAFIQFP